MSEFVYGGAFGSIAEIKQYTGKKSVVEIPRQSDRREPITRIGNGAFRNCKTVESYD